MTAYTQNVTVANDGNWHNIGASPCALFLTNPTTVQIAVSDSAPNSVPHIPLSLSGLGVRDVKIDASSVVWGRVDPTQAQGGAVTILSEIGGSSGASANTISASTYQALKAFTIGSVNVAQGDVLVQTTTTVSGVATSVWTDTTQAGVVLPNDPDAANVAQVTSSGGLTSAQLAAQNLAKDASIQQLITAVKAQGAGIAVIDSAAPPKLWVKSVNDTTGAATYYDFNTGAQGTPTFPVTPYEYTVGAVSVSNFPLTSAGSIKTAVSEPLPTGSNGIGSVVVSALPLPPGAATAASQPALNADGGALAHVTNTVTVTGGVTATLSAADASNLSAVAAQTGQTTAAVTANTTALNTAATTAHTDAQTLATNTANIVTNVAAVTTAVNTAATTAHTDAATLNTTMQAVKSAIQATINLAESIWFDPAVNPPVFYLRRDSVNESTGVVTVSWFTPDGTSVTPPNAARLINSAYAGNTANETTSYVATATGANYVSGDVLLHVFGIDTSTTPASLAYSFWLNAGPSYSGVINAPTSGTYAQATQQVSGNVSVTSGAVTATLDTTSQGYLQTVANAQGQAATGATPAAPAVGGSGVLGYLASLWYGVKQFTFTLGGLLNVNVAGASFTYSQNNSTGSSGGSTTAVSVAANGTWTGVVEAAINQSYLVVGVNSTQNGTLTVYQYIDNAGLVLELPVNTFSITANTPYSTTLAVDGNYVKVAFANNSGTTAATVYVDSYYGPLPVAPESLTQSGNFKVAVQEPLPSGTNAIGTVGVTSAPAAAAVTVTPTNTVGAYTAGQCVGGLITLANVGQGTTFGALLQSVQLAAKINYTGGFNITFFGSAPSTTFTDKATPTFNLSDVPKIVAYATITGYNQGLGTNYAVYANYYLGASVQLASSTLYAVITCVGAPTFATTTDLTLSVGTL